MPAAPVAVLFGGPSPEHDISILTGLQAERILRNAGEETVSLYWARGGGWFEVPAGGEARDYLNGAPSGAKKVEIRISGDENDGLYVKKGLGSKKLAVGRALNCLHGGIGEGGGIQGLLEILGIPSTGCSVAAAALGMDKLAFGALMAANGVPTLDRMLVSEGARPTFDGPYIVKPRYGGSSIGIEVVEDYDTALTLRRTSPHLRAGAVLEPYRPDLFDLNVAVRTAPMPTTSLVERPMKSADGIYSYAAKYLHSDGLVSAPREIPAQIPDTLAEQLHGLALRVVELAALSGIVRIDFLSDGETALVNEVNTIPGALALYLWSDPAATLLGDALTEAQRLSNEQAVTGSHEVGVALQAAGGISGKLAAMPNQPS